MVRILNKNIFSPLRGSLMLMALLLFGITASAQQPNGINSPYSQYGIGLNNTPFNMPAASAMGGVCYTNAANNMINPFNPASYATIGMESFIFDMGLSIDMSTLKNNDNSLFDADGNLGYITFAFPITRWWKTALGLMPLSDVDYQSVHTASDGLGGETKTFYEGSGGVANFFWGNGFNILGNNDPTKPQLRAGFNLNFLYGTLTRAITYDNTANDTNFFMDSRKQKDTYIKNFMLDFGLQYDQPIGKDYRVALGLSIKPGHTMNVTDNALVYTFVTNSATEYIRDTIFPSAGNNSEYTSTLEQPFTTGVGLSFQRDNYWRIAFDATFAPWSGLKYTENTNYNIFGQSPLRYDNNIRLAMGFQLLGDKNATSYWRRITYSFGGHYESGKLQLQLSDNSQHTLNEWGFGAGMSLPMRKGRSVVNLSAAYSSFGSIDLLKRNAFTFGISIGSCESWFVKRKFN